jgi:predicted transcriptional regulator
MSARNEVLNLLRSRGSEGVLQGEISAILKYSRSTISGTLAKMLKEGEIFRRRIGGKAYRIWLSDYTPFPIKNLIRIAILRAVEYPHIILTVKDLRKTGVNVRLRVFDSALEATMALATGYIDIACTPLITQTLYALLLRSIEIFAGCGFSGSGLVVKNEKFEKLVYGCSELSTMEMNLKFFLEARNVNPSLVELRYFKKPDRMVESFVKGEVSALSIWEPYLSLFRGKFHVYEFEKLLGKFPCCTLAAGKKFVKTNSKIFRRFLKMYRENTEGLSKRREEAVRLMAETLELPETLVNLSFGKFGYDYRLSREEYVEALKRFGIILTKPALKEILKLSWLEENR